MTSETVAYILIFRSFNHIHNEDNRSVYTHDGVADTAPALNKQTNSQLD